MARSLGRGAAAPVNKNESSWALAHPRNMKMGYHAPAAARATSRCLGTRESVMSLTWELSAPRIVAFEHGRPPIHFVTYHWGG